MPSLRKLLNKALSNFRLELKRLPPKIAPQSSAHGVYGEMKHHYLKNIILDAAAF